MGNHWANNCQTPKHLYELYIESLKKNPEANMAYRDGEDDMDHDHTDQIEYETHEKENDQMDYETSDALKKISTSKLYDMDKSIYEFINKSIVTRPRHYIHPIKDPLSYKDLKINGFRIEPMGKRNINSLRL